MTNVTYNIIVRENTNDNFYNVNITGGDTVITIIVNSFSKINVYKNMALQELKHYKYHGLKVV